MDMVDGVLLIGSVLATMASSRRIRDVPYPRPVFQPLSSAFAIWGVIFTLAFVYAVGVLLGGRVSRTATLLFSLAYLVSAAWAPVFSRRRFRLALATLATACALANASLLAVRPRNAAEWVSFELPVGMLAGWLTVATLLGLAIAFPSLFDRYSVFVVGSLAYSLLVVGAARRFSPLVPLAVAVLAQRRRGAHVGPPRGGE